MLLGLLLGILVGLGLASCQAIAPSSNHADWIPVQVERALSGQTVEVRNARIGTRENVRLLGLDAPDLRQQPWGPAAQQALATLLGDGQVQLETDPNQARDALGRPLAYLWKEGVLINEALIAAGYALAADPSATPLKYGDRLDYAQIEARTLERGIWDPEQPLRVAPSEFRDRFR
jgi:micrococcal nuclease